MFQSLMSLPTVLPMLILSINNPNLSIFRQTDNGVLVRMALFALVLDVADKVDDFSSPVHWYNSRQS
jgi:hypothetical protein